ncbi:zinc transporter ZntB [Kordiimonas pumila]|uniref:Zinc transporter ZntB n=1 Tax=Kordiimonas pumila TaxID=2161677 RepID=A0ABV7D5M2_9PROT|nr:zinc transporter ZntB [Kordiimonas pumila]
MTANGVFSALSFDGAKLSFDGVDAAGLQAQADWSGWVRLDVTHADCKQWLSKLLPDVPKAAIRAMTAEETRPRLENYGAGLLLILRAANLNAGKEAYDMASVRIWADEKRVITVQRQRIRALEDVQKQLGTADNGLVGSGAVVAAINLRIIERLDPVLMELEDTVFSLEEKTLDNPESALRHDITASRKEATMFRRYIAPQREVLLRLKGITLGWLESRDQFLFLDAFDHLTRFVENLDAIRERCQILHEELTTMLADQLNQRMYILSIVSIIFLPLGFLTGLLGVNLAGIPGSEDPLAFDIFLGVLIVLIVGSVVFLRVKRWF